ncbi:hypothetical protein ES319_D09G045100v1 [Gossypium barbadense]|uniref:Uncharacterized protein n=2 Tax=Gossypium TaxID=3633 RepID=A0A5J5PZ77_GOSBA|nr:hypothetical protein ES319_D09G045100v1 [Gossypium barbadense]TYG52729.1 hypothetical protein ES288_D09G052000v1 [Gossypium darwinii]
MKVVSCAREMSYSLSLAYMVESVGGLRGGGGLPYGICQWFESTYLQLMNLAETKLYDIKGEVQTRKGLRWIPRHLETRKGIVSNKMLRGEVVECRTLNGDSLVAESITSLHSDLSSIRHVESRVNQQGPPYKDKYSWMAASEVVLLGNGEKNLRRGVKQNMKS